MLSPTFKKYGVLVKMRQSINLCLLSVSCHRYSLINMIVMFIQETFRTSLTSHGQEPRKDARENNGDFQNGSPFVSCVNTCHRAWQAQGHGKSQRPIARRI